MPELHSRIVVVTGGTRGIGRAIVDAFIARGDQVWSISRNPQGTGVSGPAAHELKADVCCREQLDRAVSEITKISGGRRLDVWVNNAGSGRMVPFDDEHRTQWDAHFTANFWGTVNATRVALNMLARPGGAIINVASVAGCMMPSGHSAYAVAKAAVIALTKANAVEFAAAGLRINAVAPGPVDTAGFRAAGGDPVMRARTIPTGTMTQPEEVAAACVFLADPLASLTGQVLALDGGSMAAGCYIPVRQQ